MSASSPFAQAVSAASYIVSPDTVTADELAAMALALIADANLPKMEVAACVSRYRDGRLAYSVTAYDLDPVRNTLDMHTAYGLADTADEALRQLSAGLSAWAQRAGLKPATVRATPRTVYATGEQLRHIKELLNHPNVTRSEKTQVLLGIHQLTQESAAAEIAHLEAVTAAGWGRRYGVIGEAFQVAPIPAA